MLLILLCFQTQDKVVAVEKYTGSSVSYALSPLSGKPQAYTAELYYAKRTPRIAASKTPRLSSLPSRGFDYVTSNQLNLWLHTRSRDVTNKHVTML